MINTCENDKYKTSTMSQNETHARIFNLPIQKIFIAQTRYEYIHWMKFQFQIFPQLISCGWRNSKRFSTIVRIFFFSSHQIVSIFLNVYYVCVARIYLDECACVLIGDEICVVARNPCAFFINRTKKSQRKIRVD